MATSVIAFSDRSLSVSSDKKSATITTFFTPPSNISGEHCYVECSFWAWDYTTAPTTAINTRDVLTLTASWAQTVSGTVTSQGTKPSVAFGSICNNICYGHGPILCQIPDGPHQVEFTISRTDGGDVAGDTTSDNNFLAVFKMVPADSRQPTIGV